MPKLRITISRAERNLVNNLVNHYVENRNFLEVMLKQLSEAILGSPNLMAYVHSTKGRLKDASHLEDKLFRKITDAKTKGKPFTITVKNLFYRVNDLAGFRILHLHTEQIVSIDRELRTVLKEYKFPLVEKPKARTWDDESRAFFQRAGSARSRVRRCILVFTTLSNQIVARSTPVRFK